MNLDASGQPAHALPRTLRPARRAAFLGLLSLAAAIVLNAAPAPETNAPAAPRIPGLFARSNLVAWCIVPFDAKRRGPEERAAMLERIGLRQLAYDYRAEHIPSFDAEVEALRRHGIRLFAWWFPGELNDEARIILALLERQQERGVQLWVTGGGDPPNTPEEHQARIASEAARLRPIAEAGARIGSVVGLYNHGGWFGEPNHQIAIIKHLRASAITNVGIVYNLHHGHDHLLQFPALLDRMKPYLVALNLNGMTLEGDRRGQKILPLGQGDLDLGLLRVVRNSGWSGPVGILNHTDADAEARLLDNLEGLDWLVGQLEGKPAGPKPTPRTWKPPAAPNATP
ncbi:MAG TPA: TIM barrel protein [Verrucomicrobiota bacterium]|nr:TIM barrel protein [Verrucomicrobiota bacterium]HNU53012.1 TIM barrel protein [Verrucomicrobiota bacterium]